MIKLAAIKSDHIIQSYQKLGLQKCYAQQTTRRWLLMAMLNPLPQRLDQLVLLHRQDATANLPPYSYDASSLRKENPISESACHANGPFIYWLKLFREFWQLNLTTYKWSAVTCKGDMPVELASHSGKKMTPWELIGTYVKVTWCIFKFKALGVGHYMIVFGGTNYPFGESSSNKVSVCNLQTCTWKCLDCSGETPDEKYGQVSTQAVE